MPQGYQLPVILADKPPALQVGVVQLCRQHCEAMGVTHADFKAQLERQIRLAERDIAATCYKSNQNVHRLLGVLRDMLTTEVCLSLLFDVTLSGL